MPTTLPSRPGIRTEGVPLQRPRLEPWKLALFLLMVLRREWLNRRMTRLTARLADRPSERDEARLLAGARAWLRHTERISKLAGIPEPPETAELREIFGVGLPTNRQAREPSRPQPRP